MKNPVVALSHGGKVKGCQRTNIDGEKFYAFFAIPYAEPPLGERRFKAPEPIKPWDSVRDATQAGDPCYHRNEFTYEFQGTENCLHLNVYTPSVAAEEKTKLRPVMVWIHGGGFFYGHNKPDLYGPDHLLSQDVVLVSINYRLGFLGFLHLNDQSLNVPGNAGLKDQRMALEWVRDNIKSFGGDHNNVTIFGESAGGCSVHLHMASPTSKNLFHKAILQSGSLFCPWAYCNDVGLDFAKSIDSKICTEKEALELLAKLPMEKLYEHQEKYFLSKPSGRPVGATVEYENPTQFLTARPVDNILNSNCSNVPLMIGFTTREDYIFPIYQKFHRTTDAEKKMDPTSMIHPLLNLKMDNPVTLEIINACVDYYFKGKFADNPFLFLGDCFFTIGIILAAKLHSRIGTEPVYLYRASIDAGLNWFKKIGGITTPGTSHCDELGYIFNIDFASKITTKGPVEEEAIKRFVKLWTNFARTGNPTPEDNEWSLKWDPVTNNFMTFIDIGTELSIHNLEDTPEAERVEFWSNIFKMSPHTKNLI